MRLAICVACTVVSLPVMAVDSRLRSVPYSADEVYRLHGVAGYQIDLEFDPDERFVGIGSGDVEGLAFEAQGNHLFIKPRAINVRTNLTVLTTRRTYHFEYYSSPARTEIDSQDLIYALRFVYPKPESVPATAGAAIDASLSQASPRHEHNTDYWYCGPGVLQPIEAWDDGVHTHLHFSSRIELPALFVRNDDGSESLLNFNVEHDEVVIHRIARRFTVRRGALAGCILNRGFSGTGDALDTGTVSPEVERVIRSSAGAP
ncbi:MAG TPA: TrbG/VirB9 family P-type conjugative transfer protein [Steroidobacteraceae bacterium]|jgi:type IV secretion system protein VirB9|nr:TrbG/VirB9 family P-type conjugative transfer protein [Steroidobacteraceae bacterium]